MCVLDTHAVEMNTVQEGLTLGYSSSGCRPAKISRRKPAITGAARLVHVQIRAQTRAISKFLRSAHTKPEMYWLSTADLRPCPNGLGLHAPQHTD